MTDSTNGADPADIVSAVGRASRANLDALRRQGHPTPEELKAIPATSDDDWHDAEVLSPLPLDIFRVLIEHDKMQKVS